jgi:hypothetical protein
MSELNVTLAVHHATTVSFESNGSKGKAIWHGIFSRTDFSFFHDTEDLLHFETLLFLLTLLIWLQQRFNDVIIYRISEHFRLPKPPRYSLIKVKNKMCLGNISNAV